MLLKIYPLRAESGKFESFSNPGISCSFKGGMFSWQFNYRFFLQNIAMPATAFALGVLNPQTPVSGFYGSTSSSAHIHRREEKPMWYQHARGMQVYRCKPHLREPEMLMGEAPYQFLP